MLQQHGSNISETWEILQHHVLSLELQFRGQSHRCSIKESRCRVANRICSASSASCNHLILPLCRKAVWQIYGDYQLTIVGTGWLDIKYPLKTGGDLARPCERQTDVSHPRACVYSLRIESVLPSRTSVEERRMSGERKRGQ